MVERLRIRFSVTWEKAEKVRFMSKSTFGDVHFGRRWVQVSYLRSFGGTCDAFSLDMPWEIIYNHLLYWDLSGTEEMDQIWRPRLSHQYVMDLQNLGTTIPRRREDTSNSYPESASEDSFRHCGHKIRGNLNNTGPDAGLMSILCNQRVWNWRDRTRHITVREMKSIRIFVMVSSGKKVRKNSVKDLLMPIAKTDVVHITNSLVSGSR